MSQKIVSLLPAATEMVCLLDLEQSLVGISDDSNFPESVLFLPKISTTTLPRNLSSLEIDKQVKTAKHLGRSVFHIDRTLLAKLEPDIILTQELCPVCAPAFSEVEKVAMRILRDTKIISLEPHTISHIFDNMRSIAQETKRVKKADVVIACLEKRLSVVSQQIKNLKRPSVVIIEWLDPLMVAGHWVPEMVERAGGNMLLSKRGEKSVEVSWEQILQTNPDVLIIAPCGFSISRTMEEIVLISQREGFKNLKAYKEKNIFLMDGDAYLTRPGPRVVDGIEILVDIFYSQRGESRHSENDWRRLL